MDDDYEEYDLDDSGVHEHDVRGISAFLRDCWLTQPNFALGEILDEIFGGDIRGMSDEEIMDTLKEYLLQHE